MNKDHHCGVMKAWEATIRKTQAAAKKRATSIFGSMSVAHVDDDATADNSNDEEESPDNAPQYGEMYQADRVLPNGDYYTGHWADNFPHGHGKYVWTDGCMYVGEWFRGKTMGKGRFCWPSGATYEGEFKSGYMDGKGTYTGSNGNIYKGQWVMNLKQGHGVNSYSNGDRYEGEWLRGLQEGHGKYDWKNGNYYVGDWKNGSICGKGGFVWTNGNAYDGHWEDGVPKGSGTFKWSDGSFYVGNWSKDPTEQNGTYYPSGGGSSPEVNFEWDPQQVFDVDLSECNVCPSEKVSILPSQKKLAVWRSSKGVGSSVKPRRMSVDSRVNLGTEGAFERMRMWEGEEDVSCSGGRDMGDGLRAEDADSSKSPLQQIRVAKSSKRTGETISKSHKNYELMLNLQLGIRYS